MRGRGAKTIASLECKTRALAPPFTEGHSRPFALSHPHCWERPLSFDPATVDPQIGREIVALRDELEGEAGGGAALRAALPAPVVLMLSWMLTISEHGADLTRVMAAGMNVKVAKDVLPAAV